MFDGLEGILREKIEDLRKSIQDSPDDMSTESTYSRDRLIELQNILITKLSEDIEDLKLR